VAVLVDSDSGNKVVGYNWAFLAGDEGKSLNPWALSASRVNIRLHSEAVLKTDEWGSLYRFESRHPRQVSASRPNDSIGAFPASGHRLMYRNGEVWKIPGPISADSLSVSSH
jgi:hypothetical protein